MLSEAKHLNAAPLTAVFHEQQIERSAHEKKEGLLLGIKSPERSRSIGSA
jgi:hypothetical protein